MEPEIYNVWDNGRLIEVRFYNLSGTSTKEASLYVDYVKSRVDTPLVEIEVHAAENGFVDVSYRAEGTKFERIRRVTGYLTGDLKSWNNAKQVEERERVKHAGRRF